MPGNYQALLSELTKAGIDSETWSITGLVSIKTLDGPLIKTIVGLPLIGVFNLASELIKNSFNLLFKRREKLAKEYRIPHRLVDSMNDQSVIDWVRGMEIDIILNIRTRDIYGESILRTPKLGCVNIHHGILPDYRGTFCDLYALYENRNAGFSIHKMEKKVDAGVIFKTVVVDQGTEKNYQHYLKKTEEVEIKEIIDFFNECTRLNNFPTGIPNKTKRKIYTKNPTPKMIKNFKAQGFIL